MMKFFCLLFVLFTTATFVNKVQAFTAILSEPKIPYEAMRMGDNIENEQVYLGNLVGDPHMYEFAVGKESELVLTLVQKDNDLNIPLSLIVVKSNDNNRGVAELGRLWGKDIKWQAYRDDSLGLSLMKSDTFKQVIGAGIYKVEVSTPDNYGKYMLVAGSKSVKVGYFETLLNIRKTQTFFDGSIFTLFLSAYVYYPLGIIVLGALLFLTWRKRNLLQSLFQKNSNA